MGDLSGAVAIVTGGARGQGAAEARALAAAGASVVVADRLDAEGRALAGSLGDAAVFCHLDVAEPDQWADCVDAAVQRFGRVTVLVNNAGIVIANRLEDATLDEYLQVVRVNQVGCFLGMKAVVGPMRAAGGGSIVNVSSTAGIEGMEYLTAYAASKFAITGMTKCAAIELGRYGIRVNSVHPGSVDTPMIRDRGVSDEEMAAFGAALPLARVGRPEEVARLVLFLASDNSSYCTGAEFVIDGGLLAGPPPEPVAAQPVTAEPATPGPVTAQAAPAAGP
ncbi:MAG TPA: glucose 1-dehydrogenase [Acidimicrobiales bacterium]|nr:glucose 1-dehydrogenase [Acidimicrobiales bacterium]